jgi:hypothetical protein
VLEVISAVTAAIGKDKSSIRESSYGVAGDMLHYPEMDATHDYLWKELDKLGMADIHQTIQDYLPIYYIIYCKYCNGSAIFVANIKFNIKFVSIRNMLIPK